MFGTLLFFIGPWACWELSFVLLQLSDIIFVFVCLQLIGVMFAFASALPELGGAVS